MFMAVGLLNLKKKYSFFISHFLGSGRWGDDKKEYETTE
jgi:hypothetical protein